MKKMWEVKWHPNLTIGVLLYLLSRGRENTTQSGGTTESMAKSKMKSVMKTSANKTESSTARGEAPSESVREQCKLNQEKINCLTETRDSQKKQSHVHLQIKTQMKAPLLRGKAYIKKDKMINREPLLQSRENQPLRERKIVDNLAAIYDKQGQEEESKNFMQDIWMVQKATRRSK